MSGALRAAGSVACASPVSTRRERLADSPAPVASARPRAPLTSSPSIPQRFVPESLADRGPPPAQRLRLYPRRLRSPGTAEAASKPCSIPGIQDRSGPSRHLRKKGQVARRAFAHRTPPTPKLSGGDDAPKPPKRGMSACKSRATIGASQRARQPKTVVMLFAGATLTLRRSSQKGRLCVRSPKRFTRPGSPPKGPTPGVA